MIPGWVALIAVAFAAAGGFMAAISYLDARRIPTPPGWSHRCHCGWEAHEFKSVEMLNQRVQGHQLVHAARLRRLRRELGGDHS